MMNTNTCKECREPTKYATGCWDGRDEHGNHTYGYNYDCHNMDCPIKQEGERIAAKCAAEQARVREENVANHIVLGKLKGFRLQKGMTLRKMANYLDVSPSRYCDYENERLSMPPEKYRRAMEYLNTLEDYR